MTQFIRPVFLAALILATTITLVEGVRPGPQTASLVAPANSLRSACDERADELRSQSGGQLTVLVRPPWILAGEATSTELQATYTGLVEPAWRAMQREYFHTAPDQPITALLFSTERAYRHWAEQLFFDRGVSRFGYYKPGRRVIVVNSAEGPGALFHEMTHALMAFDFPDAPLWCEEGLASLHEAAGLEASAEGPTLRGQVNWRLHILRRSIRSGRPLHLQTLLHVRELRGPEEAVRYAEARYFCLFLQDEHLLATCYQRLRHRGPRDPWGERAVQTILPDTSWTALDARFLRWLSSLSPQG